MQRGALVGPQDKSGGAASPVVEMTPTLVATNSFHAPQKVKPDKQTSGIESKGKCIGQLLRRGPSWCKF